MEYEEGIRLDRIEEKLDLILARVTIAGNMIYESQTKNKTNKKKRIIEPKVKNPASAKEEDFENNEEDEDIEEALR